MAGELPHQERNALLHLFSAAPEQVQYGAQHYQLPSADTSSIVNQLFGTYQREGLNMPYTIQDFRRYYLLERFKELKAEERRAVLREILEQLSPEQRLAGLPPEKRLAGLSDDQVEALLKRRRKQSAAAKKRKPKPGR